MKIRFSIFQEIDNEIQAEHDKIRSSIHFYLAPEKLFNKTLEIIKKRGLYERIKMNTENS